MLPPCDMSSLHHEYVGKDGTAVAHDFGILTFKMLCGVQGCASPADITRIHYASLKIRSDS